MVAALVSSALVLGARGVLPQPLWTSVHVVTLGVLTSSVLQWSWYFTRALLHLPADDRRAGRNATGRLVTFNVAVVAVVAGMWAAWAAVAVGGAGAVGALIAWHGVDLVRAARTRLGNRYAVVVRYYVASAGFLVVGCMLAGFLVVAMFDPAAPDWVVASRDRLTLAHALVNVGGWLGLAVLGTLVTLGPTVLRVRIHPAALDRAVAMLPALVVGVAGAAVAAVLGWLPGVGVGLLVVCAAAVLGVGVPLVSVARGARGGAFSAWAMGGGLVWSAVGVVGIATCAFTAADATALRDASLPWVVLLGAGGVTQILVGALSYLMPVVIGGGPSAVRVGMGVIEVAWPARTALRASALTLLAVGSAGGGGLVSLWWAVVLAAYAVDVVVLAVAGVRQARSRAALGDARPSPVPVTLTRRTEGAR